MLGEDLDPQLLEALRASKAEYEAQQKRLEEEAEAQVDKDIDPELLEALKASQAEYEALQKKSEEESIADEELEKVVALSLQNQLIATTTPTLQTAPGVTSNPIPEKEAINLSRQLRFVFKIPGEDIESCLAALQAQKHWENTSGALAAYEKSTKDYSAKGLKAFMQEGPTEKEVATLITKHELEKKQPANTKEKKRRFK